MEARSAGTSVTTAAETTRLECVGPRRECGDRVKSKPERVDYPGATTLEWISEIIYEHECIIRLNVRDVVWIIPEP